MKKGIIFLTAVLCLTTVALWVMYDRATGDIADLKIETAALQSSIHENEQTIDALTRQNRDGEAAIRDLTADVADREAQIAGLTADVTDREAQIEGLKADVADREAQIAGLTADVTDREVQIAGLKADVSDRDTQIADLTADVADREAQIESLASDAAERDAQLRDLQADIDQNRLELDARAQELTGKEDALRAQEDLISAQTEALAASDAALSELQNRMESVAGLRLTLLRELRVGLAGALGDEAAVTVGRNGSILLRGGDFFALGSWEIRPEARPFLDELIGVLAEFLEEGENARYVDSIVIAGHTDSTGGAMQNREISSYRANAVLTYLLEGGDRVLEPYAEYFCAAGYGGTRPVEPNDTEEGRAANRRIEISLILNDDAVRELAELSETEHTGEAE